MVRQQWTWKPHTVPCGMRNRWSVLAGMLCPTSGQTSYFMPSDRFHLSGQCSVGLSSWSGCLVITLSNSKSFWGSVREWTFVYNINLFLTDKSLLTNKQTCISAVHLSCSSCSLLRSSGSISFLTLTLLPLVLSPPHTLPRLLL